MARQREPGLKERAARRRRTIVANRAANFKEAEDWDLDFWQSLTPEQRLSVLVDIHRDVEKVEQARSRSKGHRQEDARVPCEVKKRRTKAARRKRRAAA